MQYFDESGAVIQCDQVDLTHGWLEPKELLHHEEVPAKTHQVEKIITDDFKLTMTVTDAPAQPAWDETVSQIYHYTGPTQQEKAEMALSDLREQVGSLRISSEKIPAMIQTKIDDSLTSMQEAIAEVYELVTSSMTEG